MNNHDNKLIDQFIDQLKRERVEALMVQHNKLCRLADYLDMPDLKAHSAERTMRKLEREKDE